MSPRPFAHRNDTPRSESDRLERRGVMEALDTSQALVWFDANGGVLDANENACALFSYDGAEILKQDYFTLCGTGPRQLLAERREWNRICEGGLHHNERSYHDKDHHQIWTSVNFAVLHHSDGSVRRVLGIFIDMSRFAWKPNDSRWGTF